MLQVSVSLTLGSKLYEQQGVGFRLRRAQLPALDRLEVLLPRDVVLDAEPGEEASLSLNSGDAEATVFTGRLTEIRHSFSSIRLLFHNGGLDLARYRPAATFEQLSVKDVITSLCGDVDVDVAMQTDGATLSLYVADGRATALQEIARLGGLIGIRAAFDGDGRLHLNEEGGPAGELALRYGRELLEVSSARCSADQASLTVVGEGAGEPGSEEGRWVITDFLAGGAEEPGPEAKRVSRPELRTTDDTEVAAAALSQRRAAAAAQVRLRTWLHPGIEPGMRLELHDMPAHQPLGECRVAQLVSTQIPGGASMTEIRGSGEVGGASAFGDLLGALL